MLNLNLFAQDGYLAFETCCQTIWQRKSPLPKQIGSPGREQGGELSVGGGKEALASSSLVVDFDFSAHVFPEPCPPIMLRHMLTIA